MASLRTTLGVLGAITVTACSAFHDAPTTSTTSTTSDAGPAAPPDAPAFRDDFDAPGLASACSKDWVFERASQTLAVGKGRTGNACRVCENTADLRTGVDIYASRTFDPARMPPGSLWRLEAWVSVEDPSTMNTIEMLATTVEGSAPPVLAKGDSVTPSSSWQRITVDVSVPAAATEISAGIHALTEADSACFLFDDASFTPLF